ncbi:translocation/assembly module TamB domain-containing protein [Sneathiella sp. HT1-7]|uniref:translocation/assembly module TamB domain-containing protein n=1 Tax=Sneathiella sp. HT1-7 TaxID=2887192 RepID=UPI001D14B2B2|nr:translocation/assembly module TamB domain-containing protein [Sneathiella sp. HT1-7]MCC3305367.1 translocation/assembly module TamB domain-containing protein [Sneathiella sp. HT1-7]
MTRKKLIAAIICAPFLILLIIITGGYAFLQMDSGRALLVSQIEEAASTPGELELKLGPLDGNIFGDFSLQQIRLRDAMGEWLSIEDIAVSWSPLDLISGTLSIHVVTAKTLSVDRQPDLPSSEEENKASAGIPSLPIDIRLSRFEILEINIAEPVVGQAADLALLMNLNAKTDDVIRSEVKLTELNGPGALLTGGVDFDPVRETLAIEAKLDEPEGGLISRFLVLPGYPAIKMDLVGNGVLNAWRGQFSASAGKLFDADFAIATQGAEKINIELKGGGALDQSLAADIPLIDDSRISVTASLILDTESTEVTLSSANIENAVLQLRASGKVDPSNEAINLAVKTALRDTAPVNDLIAPAAIRDGTLDLDIHGTFDNLTANAILKATDLDIDNSLAARSVTGTFTSELDLTALTTVPVTGSAALGSLSKLPDEVVGLVGENLDIDFEMDYGVKSEKLTLRSLRLLGTHISAQSQGEISFADLGASADISIKLDELSRIAPMKGELLADLTLSSGDVSKSLTGQLNAHTVNLDMGDANLTSLLGTGPTLALSLDLDLVGELLSLSDIKLATEAGDVRGHASLPLAFDTINADLTASLPSLANLSDLAGIPLSGNAELTALLSGSPDDPSINGDVKIGDLQLDGTLIGVVDASYNASALATSPVGGFSAQLRHAQVTADAFAKFAMLDYSRLELSDIVLTEQKNKITGNLTVPFDGTPLKGTMTGKIPNLAPIAELMEETASGSIEFTATLADAGGTQSVKATMEANSLNVAAADIGIAKVTAGLDVIDALGTPSLKVNAKADDILAAGQQLKELTATASGDLSNIDYRFGLLRGQEPELKLSGSGTFAFTEAMTKLRLVTLDGAFADRKIELTKPLYLEQEGGNINLDDFALTFGAGSLRGSGKLSNETARMDLAFNDLPVDLVELIDPAYAVSGGLDGDVTLRATKGTPATGNLSIKAKDIKLEDEDYGELPTFENNLTAKLSDGQLTFQGNVKGLEATSIDVSGQLPFDISLDTRNILVDEKKPVKLDININSDINKIWPLLALDTQDMKGQLATNATINGTISAPVIAGQARISNGYFEDVEQGTILKDITLNANITDADTLKIEFNASDSQGGKVTSSGTVDFAKLTEPELDLNIVLSNLLAINRDEISAITDANIDIRGNLQHLTVEGEATTREVELNIGGSVAPNVVELKYETINKPGEKPREKVKEAEPSKISLDFDLDMPSRVFIRGRGLDSEWKGNFTIRGTADKPVIEGYISPVRGQFTFAGKSFELTEGEISLVGGETINPELSLKATYTGSNVTAIVTISGTATNPEISFSSPDGLPQDEVLAQVLFGKSSGKLSAIEAVQLAETVAALSGKLGSGGGITGFVRDTLGVDVVSASTNEQTGESEVSVGKYVSDNIYVGVDQGTQSGGTRAKVQIELTPNISVESEMGQSTDSSVGIFWKWDY